MKRYAIIGFGCAGVHGARAIRALDRAGEIHVFDKLDMSPFNPMLTTYYASERISREGAFPLGTTQALQEELELRIHGDTPVRRVREDRTLELADGSRHAFDRILIATGARALLPPLEGLPDPRVMVMRTYADAEQLRACLAERTIRRAVVVGASMVGIKVAELLFQRGIRVTVADGAQWLFPLAALPHVGREVERRLTLRGMNFVWGSVVQAITPAGVLLGSGQELEADLIVLCIGTRANVELAAPQEGETAVKLGRGIVVDERMETSWSGVYAAGDCCEALNLQTGQTMPIGLWANAANQGETAGRAMAGYPEPYGGSIVHNITHFMDMDFIGLGDNRLSGRCVVWGDLHKGPYLEAVVNEGRLQCVNILDCYPVSGVLKSLIIAQWSRPGSVLTPAQEAVLRRNGVSPEWIKEVGGRL